MKSQRGVGLMEVLVSLVILAIAVLGFAALQFRALDAIQEANDRTAAMTLARDLAEKIRVNRTQLSKYKSEINASGETTAKSCVRADSDKPADPITSMCTRIELATFDASKILGVAKQKNMTIIISDCQGGDRQCVYVAWGDTAITATSQANCMVSGVYVAGAKCLVMEAYGS
ncbi:type IV pilus modification protein PilV [Acinetobacter sp. CIP 101966]|jgi:type IV pilus assembly protein PilV|uniref:type IV pilus modification protein PilV n=1 Tax=Acinetobacter TaxID=469 RepID=UPI0002D02571|nr:MULTISPECIES: type IV pilus modification protein PilV [Acinetobacter]ENX26074.1 type IV pilus modification protein PilV [Acinetobacter sp. CIP 101966]MCU4439810.1 type IV pilus modification protein PilV [Acinetobacter lwoffii]